ncbi:hypothetical protein, conserved [Trypanosoma vivax Y486]|uniref:Uncharacterized protein n=1 Tax=Trypanosoma vivax (strain Y486) TaxID=1055687 RepID=F9WSC3_TRYVY|nr:hypothetical protein, conserved [Trypanosoma vivax Y486]|eukprot:CCD20462.1 hypothetical protein, conserved [Trypanosoma vivax Y486]
MLQGSNVLKQCLDRFTILQRSEHEDLKHNTIARCMVLGVEGVGVTRNNFMQPLNHLLRLRKHNPVPAVLISAVATRRTRSTRLCAVPPSFHPIPPAKTSRKRDTSALTSLASATSASSLRVL